jgi:ABC-type multidrug transport system fused ATPase/permease subunit
MMKRERVFVLIFLVLVFTMLLFSFVNFVSAQSIDTGFVDSVQENAEGAKERIDQLTNEEQRTEYLKKEWAGILGKSESFGPTIRAFDSFFTGINPFTRLILGIEYSLGWAFIFAVLTWIVLFVLLYDPLRLVFGRKLFGFVGAFAIASLIGLAGIIKRFVDLLESPVTGKFSVAILFFIYLVAVVVIKTSVGGVWKWFIKKFRKDTVEEQEKKDRAVLHLGAEKVRRELKDGK